MNEEHRSHPPRVVVLGGGFGGMAVCKALAREDCQVTLIDQKNHHLFQPLLYQVATAGLSAPDIACPLRGVFRSKKNISIFKETVSHLDLDGKRVVTDHRELGYEYLVIALGARPSFFGNDHWAEHTLQLKTLSDALEIRRRALNAFEEAEVTPDAAEADRLMTVAIVGGGPTGVELAGAFAELKQHVFTGNFRNIDPRSARIILIEAMDRLLLSYDESQGEYARRRLEKMGVEVQLGKPVQDVGPGVLRFDGEELRAATIIWAAGVQAPALTRDLPVETDRGGRIVVDPDLSLPGYPEVFAIGDIAKAIDAQGNEVPGLAPAAMQMGRHVADHLRVRMRGSSEAAGKPFRYVNKGDMATIGRSAAIADIRGWKTNGFFAWILWLFVHLMFLVGFRNRIAVFIDWVYAYCTFDRGARIIIGESDDPGPSPLYNAERPLPTVAEKTTD